MRIVDPLERLPNHGHAAGRQRELLDLLCVGIEPRLDLSDRLLLIGTLSSTARGQLSPSHFKLLCLPLGWEEIDSILNGGIPQEHAAQLEFKRNQTQKRLGSWI
jgi:hypothetical protein